MQRYNAANCTNAVNNNTVGVASSRESSRAELSSIQANFPLNRRTLQLTPYKLKCDKDPLNSRLAPPDFHAPTPNCPEETLTKEYVQSGYRETVEGLEEAREISLSQVQTFTDPVILKCKESIRKYHRAINESRAQKRKAGQVYGVPLGGNLLSKHAVFPEQKPCSEDFRKKWIEGLSQPHKSLRSLADHVPHGYRKKSLFEVLIRNNVPLLRASWFIKVTYLNQVRPGSSSISSGAPDRSQFLRTEQWTKDIIDYLQHLLDEFVSRNNSNYASQLRDRSSQIAYAGSMQHKVDPMLSLIDGEEPTLHFKWRYVVRLLQWHHAEGLILPSLIIDWVLNQLQDKDLLEILQLLLPIVYGVIETVYLSQNYVRTLVGIAIRFIREPSPGGSDLVDNSRRAYTISALVEMLRFLILSVPDTFVALNCFPLPSCVVSNMPNDSAFLIKMNEEAVKLKSGSMEGSFMIGDRGLDVQGQSMSINCVVSSIQKRADNLAKAARSGNPGRNVAKAVQALDAALLQGDLSVAYKCLFDDLCDGAVDKRWVAEISSCLRSSLKWIGTVSSSFICSVFFLCEWATCEFGDFRTGPPHGFKFTGRRDFSQVIVAIRLLELKMRRKPKVFHKKGSDNIEIYQSPGPLHDIVVCWIDQHESQNGEGFKRLEFLIIELIRAGIFYPHAYVRQLIVSGILDRNDSSVDVERRKRHYKVLKHLPGPYIRGFLEDALIRDATVLSEVMRVYTNERRLLLRELLEHPTSLVSANGSSSLKRKSYQIADKDCSLRSKDVNNVSELEEMKSSISILLQFPISYSTPSANGSDESEGGVKMPFGSIGSLGNRIDFVEGTPGCEECRRSKRQKICEERSSYDDEDFWWAKKGIKTLESFRTEPPLNVKAVKQASRGRQKTVRKTQSLAQLAAARIEGSQGASTSHLCDSRISCPHHGSGHDIDASKLMVGIRTFQLGDIVSIGKALKKMPLVQKRAMSTWLMSVVKQLIEESGKIAGQYSRPQILLVDDHGSSGWKLAEDEFSAILYLMDASNDIVSAVHFLVWLLPKVSSCTNSIVHGGRNIKPTPRNVENEICAIGEACIVSALRRYENVLVAADLVPEILSASMHRAAAVMASSGKFSGSAALVFSRHLFRKYGNLTSVTEWGKNSKATFDKRLVSELESGRSSDGEFGLPLGVPAGVEDFDVFLRQKITSAQKSRTPYNMREAVNKSVDDAFHSLGKEKKHLTGGAVKNPTLEKWDDGYQIAQQMVAGLLECMRQTGGAAQEGDPTLVSYAVSAIVNSVGQAVGKIPDLTASASPQSSHPPTSSLIFARYILRIHLTCLCLLKEALGERQSRVFEIALATEASSALLLALYPPKSSRGQFQPSPESHDPNSNVSNEILNSSTKPLLNKTSKIMGAVSALVVGAVLQGIISLERIVSVVRLKEGLDVIQFVRNMRSNSNGNMRSSGSSKVECSVEVFVHWFRVLVGNCRTVSDGVIVELLGEASIVALSRNQRMLPLEIVFPPAYSMFGFLLWRRYIINSNISTRDDISMLYQSVTLAVSDAIKHLPFRDVCLRDGVRLYNLIAADPSDSEFAAILDSSGLDIHLKVKAFVPLRARTFLDAMIDCKLPQSTFNADDVMRPSENETKLMDKLVHTLDTLQPAKFHWQWLELRLLLNEQALMEKVEAHDTSLVEALRSLSPVHSKSAASENENNFIEIVLTRLLVRPDAAPLFSEVVHLLGRSLEDSMLLHVKWFLGGQDVLFGRKSIRQRLINIAESRGLSTKTQVWKPWGWCQSGFDLLANKGDKKRKIEVASLEEGELVDDGINSKRNARGSGLSQVLDVEAFIVSQQHLTEKALIDLLLPCIDQSSDDSRITFASELIKQINNIEQQISAVTRGANKQPGTAVSGVEGPSNKGSSRKGIRGGSPGLARRLSGQSDAVLPSPSALRASMSLRLQLLLRLIPVIWADGEPSGRNMRHMLATVVLRLLGSRVVYEDADQSITQLRLSAKRDFDSLIESSASLDLYSASLFDRLLLVLHGLLSSCQPNWLKSRFGSKSHEASKEVQVFDREVAESLQNELNRMQLPDKIRWRIQTAMPYVFPSLRRSISCQPPSVPHSAVAALQPSVPLSGVHPAASNLSLRNPVPSSRSNGPGKTKSSSLQPESDIDIDPWTLLEEGAGSGSSSTGTSAIGGSDNANLKATSWLRGAVRVRRTDLTYIGPVDEDS